jgi:integrase
MASVEKRANGTYLVRWREQPGAPQRYRAFDRKGDADRFRVSLEHTILDGSYVSPDAGRRRLGDYARTWMADQPWRPSTRAITVIRFNAHIDPALGRLPLATLTPSRVQAWVTGLSHSLAPSTTEGVYRLLAAICRAAVADRVIASSPCGPQIRLPRRETGAVTPPSPETVEELLGAAEGRWRAAVVLGAYAGLRAGEVRGLTVDRVDWLRRTVRVDRQAGHAGGWGPTKTPASNRTVPVTDALLAIVASVLEPGAAGLILPNRHGEPLNRNRFGDGWHRVCAAAGVDGVRFHDLRHFCASALIAGGVDVKGVQAVLGHATAAETLDTYGHLWPDTDDRVRHALRQLGSGQATTQRVEY